jgi:hypothetical protein
MKTQSKLVSVGALAAVVALVVPQAFAFATTTQATGGTFCTKFSTISAQVTARIPKRQDFRNEKLDGRTTTINNLLQLRLTKIDDKRDTWDQNRENKYARLETAASTTEQKAAVQTFMAAIDAAVGARRAAVDTAVAAFQSGVNELLASRQTQLDTSFATLTSSTKAAIDTASAACAGGTDAKTVREQFVSDIKAANTAFRASIKPTNVRSSVEALRTTRDAAIKSAVSAFKATQQQALATLKAAFGK